MKNKSYLPILAVLGAIMLAVVAVIAPSQSFLGHDVVYAQTSEVTDDATLFDLELLNAANVDIMPQTGDDVIFAPTRMTYSVRAASETNKVTVNPTKNNLEARIVSITPPDRDQAEGHQVALTGGSNTVITVTVASEDSTVTERYTVTVYQVRTQASDDAELSLLSLSDATLSPRFASAKTSYTGRAAYSTDETTVSYTEDIGATVTISAQPTGGTAVDMDADPDASGYQVALEAGVVTTITVTVTAENTVAGDPPYTIAVYRENLVKSDNANLVVNTGLTLRDGPDPDSDTLLDANDGYAYLPATKSYPNVRVANSVRAATVVTNTAHPGAVAVITPSDQESEIGGHQVRLSAGAKTAITVGVTAEDGSTDTYSVTIYRARRLASDDDTFSALSLSGVTLSSAFDSAKTSYMGRAAYSTNKTTVSYTEDIGAMVAISAQPTGGTAVDMDADPDASGYQVDLDAGVVTTITMTVTAENGVAGDTPYTITVYRENLVKSDNPSLAETTGLTLRDGPDPDSDTLLAAGDGFEYLPGTKSYPDVKVGNDVDDVTVVTNMAHPGAVAVITPSDQDSLSPGHQVILGSGAKTDITVEVTAEDGTTMDTYSVTIYRARRVPSTDADLSALSLSGVTLSSTFDSAKTSYMGRAAYSTDETTVSYTEDIGAMVAISAQPTGGTAVDMDADPDASGYQVALEAGVVTTITVTVTAENTVAGDPPYTIAVYRENLPPSDNASLGALTLMGINETNDQAAEFMDHGMDPAAAFEYAPATKSYPNVRVVNGAHVVTVDATPAQMGATAVTTPSDQDSLSPGHQVILGSGAKTDIMVVVTAEDGTTTEAYGITIYRERRVLSNNAELSALSLSDVTLSPLFASDKIEYIGSAGFSTQLTTVSYTADVGAQSVVIGDNAETPVALADADPSASGHQVRLIKGQATVFTVTVTAEGHTVGAPATMEYTITVYRDNAPSSDATLQTLSLSGLTLMPAFDAATTAYTAEVEMLETTMVEAMATHPGAMVQGAGAKTLIAGENTISVTVMAEDGTSETYTVTVTVLDMVTPEGTLLDRYDADDSGDIDLSEVSAAIDDYFNDDLTLDEVSAVIDLYFG